MTTPSYPLLHHRWLSQTGQPVLLLHGLLGSGDNLAGLGRALQAEGFASLLPDLCNHGRSYHRASVSIETLADDLLRLLDHYQLDRLPLVGHSLGGKVCLWAAQQQPERIAGVVMADIAPVTYPDGHRLVFQAIAAVEAAAPRTRQEAQVILQQQLSDPALISFLLKSLQVQGDTGVRFRFHADALRHHYESLRGYPRDATPYCGPVLYLKGSESDYLRDEYRTAIGQLTPNAQLKVLQGAGHWLHADKPVAFNRQVVRFLQSLPSVGG